MKTLSRVSFLMLLLVAANSHAMLKETRKDKSGLVIHRSGFSAPEELAVQKIFRNNKKEFFVVTDTLVSPVDRHDVSNNIRAMSSEQLMRFLNENHGNIRVKQFKNGQFRLDDHVYGNGGGPFTAMCAYWVTKISSYAVLCIVGSKAINQVSVGVGGAVGGERGAEIGAVVGGAVATTTRGVVMGGAAARIPDLASVPGANQVGTAIAGAAMNHPGIADAAQNMVAQGAGIAIITQGPAQAANATIAGIEVASSFMHNIFLAIPWLP